MRDRRIRQDSLCDFGRSGDVPQDALLQLPGVDQHHRSTEHGDGRMLVQPRDLAGKPIGQRNVVGVKPGDVLSARHADRMIGRCRRPLVLSHCNANALIAGGRRVHDPGRAIGRAVVDKNDLDIAIGLGEQALDSSSDPSRGVIGRHEGAHPRIALNHRPAPSSPRRISVPLRHRR